MFIKVEVKSKDPVVYLIDQKELLIGSSPEICHLKTMKIDRESD